MLIQKRTMRPQSDSSKKVEANPATKAASNSHGNDVEGVLKGPKVRCTGLLIGIVRNQNKKNAVEYWARVLPPWESANRSGFIGNHSPDRKMASGKIKHGAVVRLAPFAFSIRGSSLGRGEGRTKRTGGVSRAGRLFHSNRSCAVSLWCI